LKTDDRYICLFLQYTGPKYEAALFKLSQEGDRTFKKFRKVLNKYSPQIRLQGQDLSFLTTERQNHWDRSLLSYHSKEVNSQIYLKCADFIHFIHPFHIKLKKS